MMYNTASSDNVQTRENVSSQSVQSLVDQMLQLSQNLQTLVELQTLVAKQQLSKGVVEVQAPTGEKIAKPSTPKDSTPKTLPCQSPLSSVLENPSQGLTEGGIRGGDIGGERKIAGTGLQIVKKRKLQNKTTAHMPAPDIARMTRSSVLKAARPASWIMDLVAEAEVMKVDV
jgi:hypothetical protein